MTDEISGPSTNVFADLDLPHHAKALEIVEKHVSYTDLSPDEGLLMTVDGGNDNALVSAISQALREAEEAEREACAKVAENALGYAGVPCTQAAALIRARGEKDNG